MLYVNSFIQFREYIERQQSQLPQTPTGPLNPPLNQETTLTDRDIEILYFYLNRKDIPKLKLDDFTAEIVVY